MKVLGDGYIQKDVYLYKGILTIKGVFILSRKLCDAHKYKSI